MRPLRWVNRITLPGRGPLASRGRLTVILSIPLILCILFELAPRLVHAAPSAQGGDLTPGYWERSTLPEMGLATFYSAGTMDWVWNYRRTRNEVRDCPECVGAVALLRAGDIGRKVWLQPPGGELAGPFMVVDCARTEDVGPLVDRNWVVDVSYEVGQLWGMTRPLDDVIVWADPAEGNAPAPPDAAPPAYIDPSQVVVTAPTATPEPAQAPPGGWPTRLPGPRGTVAAAAPGETGMPSTPPLPPPIAGTPTITAPTATPGPAGTAPPATTGGATVPGAASTTPPAAAATEPPAVALGRPGAGVLSRPTVSVESLMATPRPTPTPRPTRDPTRPTPTPLLAPVSTPVAGGASAGAQGPALPGMLSQDDASALGRLWQAFLHLIGR
jgi:hypothetical protein